MLRNVTSSISSISRASLLSKRAFHVSLIKNQVIPFGMPAMSPTMEEGGIVSWKVKEGDSFASGDVLLEVETDKATIAVEAQDDGIMAKIIKHDGDKEIKVGYPIAFLAEPGDNLAELKYPPIEEDSTPASTPAPTPAPTPAKTEETKKVDSSAPSFKGGEANPSQTFFPSVEILLEKNNISHADALSKITATGPKGRLLKGDVLAYLGLISLESNSKIASYIQSKEHLDLSNIELRVPAPPKSEEAKPSADTEKAEKPKKVVVKVNKSFVIPASVPSSSIPSLVAKASHLSEVYAYGSSLSAPSDLIDPIFEDLVAPPRNTERFTVSTKITTQAPESTDIIDDFDFEPFQEPVNTKSALTVIDVELIVNPKVYDAKARAEKYVERFGDFLAKVEAKYA